MSPWRTIGAVWWMTVFWGGPALGQGLQPAEVWSPTRARSPAGPENRWAGVALQEVAPPDDGGLTFLGTAKWASLAISAGAAVYGFSLNSQADDIFQQLDDICLEEPARCEHRNPDDSFGDSSLESLYQQTLTKDRQARAALIVSQVTLGAAVLFFIMDLSNKSPPNIPYDPPVTLQVGLSPSGGYEIGARMDLGN